MSAPASACSLFWTAVRAEFAAIESLNDTNDLFVLLRFDRINTRSQSPSLQFRPYVLGELSLSRSTAITDAFDAKPESTGKPKPSSKRCDRPKTLRFKSTLRFAGSNYVWGRFENVDRTSELLFKNVIEPANFEETIVGRVQASTIGYARDFKLIPRFATAIGGQATFYAAPDSLKPIYGSHPVGVVLFVRVRLVPKQR